MLLSELLDGVDDHHIQVGGICIDSREVMPGDLFIAIGTSGNVYPASGFYQIAKTRKAHTVELNLAETESAFDTHVYGPATEVVPAYFESLLPT